MTRIRNILKRFRARRAQHLTGMDSVSFEAFCNEAPPESHNRTKESSLCDLKSSPCHSNTEEYVRFSKNSLRNAQCPRPSLAAILLLIVLLAVFLILPIIYLLHCFGIFSVQNMNWKHVTLKDMDHYEPSSFVHEQLAYSKTPITKIVEEPKSKQLPIPPKPDYKQCKRIQEVDRFDCYPETGGDRNKCEARGCCWIPPKSKPTKYSVLHVPHCFYPLNYNTYEYVNVTETAFGIVAFLKRLYKTPYPEDVEFIKMIVKNETDTRLHIKIIDPIRDRFESKLPELPIVDKASTNITYEFFIDRVQPGFKVLRKSDNTVIFDASFVNNFMYSNQFLQISAKLPSNNIYGLGDHKQTLKLPMNWTRLTMFNHDASPDFNQNLYSSHPFYLMIENSTNCHGVVLLNTNAMDVILQPSPAITYRTIGGILNFYFFLGPSPSDVISQYTDLIGRPFIPPFWSLGFHLCRFGYYNLDNVKRTMQRNIDAGIPLDVQWIDSDYMQYNNDFTYDKKRFRDLPEFIKSLHDKGMHHIPMLDPGISAGEKKDSYPPYDKGIEMDIFVKDLNKQPFKGKVWNEISTVWPDFTHPNVVEYWTSMLHSQHDEIPFDGLWIDMNDPSNLHALSTCPNNTLENPPYLPAVYGNNLSHKTLCMSAKHYAGDHYNVHNVYALAEAIVTNFALAEIRGKRPIIITRSSFPGTGKFSGLWTGDIVSDWTDLRYSIPQILNFNLFGIPLVGADICGFVKNTTVSLCNRWMQLGAFYPFARNHNDRQNKLDQDPANLGPIVISSSIKALNIRYSLLPYLYTLFWKAHLNGDTVARPLFFEFVEDEKTHGIDTQFLWGPALMIAPVLEENTTIIDVYLPDGVWYDYHTKSEHISKGEVFSDVLAPEDTIPLFVRGGYIIPQQYPKQTTTETRKTKMQLLVALDLNGNAAGELYWDDGDSLNTYEEAKYSIISFSLESNVLKTENTHWGGEHPPNLNTVTILGVLNAITEVSVNNETKSFVYNRAHQYLLIDNLDLSFQKENVINFN